jgi:hypothetical protein
MCAHGLGIDEQDFNGENWSVDGSETSDDDSIDDVVNDNLQHLNDILGADDDDDVEGVNGGLFSYNSFNDIDLTEVSRDKLLEVYESCRTWTWTMSHQERQKAVYILISLFAPWVKGLCQKAEKYVDEARKLRAQASGRVLKSAVVIGGTIVGAATRLAALRAADPFAIIVEEACEVMEPTLIAVLSVASVQKVQLIGDHRQLPAFVNNCWYDLACSMPAIKTSLFERLVVKDVKYDDEDSSEIWSILEVQRRMRPAISNLTKHHYKDVIAIKDHPCTLDQKVDGRLKEQQWLSNAPKKSLWESAGRLVPGIGSCVYFWNIKNNAESKNKAGLSACNDIEADAIVRLVGFLILCGIGRSSIAVITPYSGQKRLLTKKLSDAGLFKFKKRDISKGPQYEKHGMKRNINDSCELDTVLVSTVDRYQGDENDIVILSLVRARPGNRFVGLLNRFIVASSRARLGFYVVGSMTAVEGPTHWNDFLEGLAKCESSEDNPYVGSKCTDQLPICCPQHRESTRSIPVFGKEQMHMFPDKSASWNKFCNCRCNAGLICGHKCSKSCHFINSAHPACTESITRPCLLHVDEPLICGTVVITEGESLVSALTKWKCSIDVSHRLPCDHVIRLKCYEKKKLDNGLTEPVICHVKVADFIHPTCNHVFKNLTCSKRRKLEAAPPLCKEQVVFKKACGHTISMQCHQAIAESENPRKCQEQINITRPRCSHLFSLKCCEYTVLKQAWANGGHIGIDDNTIDEGFEYGPDEDGLETGIRVAKCSVPVHLRAACGHVFDYPCSQGFDMVAQKKIPLCQKDVNTMCYLCNMAIEVPCHLKDKFEEWKPFNEVAFIGLKDSKNKTIINEDLAINVPVREASSEELWKIWRLAKCSSELSLQKSCHPGHVIPVVTCKDVLQKIILKKMKVKCRLPIDFVLCCGHSTEVICDRKADMPPPKCNRKNEEYISFQSCDHRFKPKSCADFQKMYNDRDLECMAKVDITLHRCRHQISIPCKDKFLYDEQPRHGWTLGEDQIVHSHKQFNYCLPCVGTICQVPINFEKSCGHIISNIPCDNAFLMKDGKMDIPVCKSRVEAVSPLCGHSLNLSCPLVADLQSWEPWPDHSVHPKITVRMVGGTREKCFSIPLPNPETHMPQTWTPMHDGDSLVCKNGKSWINFETCGHMTAVPCSDLFSIEKGIFNKILCSTIMHHRCSGPCGKSCEIGCHEYQQTREFIESQCNNKVDLQCNVCHINISNASCSQRIVECHSMVECVLPCGHPARPWKCGVDPDPRDTHNLQTNFNENCVSCVSASWEKNRDISVNIDLLQNEAKRIMLTELECTTENMIRETRLEPPFEGCEKTRDTIISRYIDSIESRGAKLIIPPITNVSSCDEAYVQANYDLVFCEIPASKDPRPDGILKRFSLESTVYGRGKRVSLLRKETIENLASASGVVKLCIAMAYKCNLLTDTEPFTTTEGKQDDIKLKANDQRRKCFENGYDCVQVYNEFNVQGTATNNDRVYWEAGAIVPVSIVEIQLDVQCVLCGDYYGRNREKGALCTEGHFLCYDDDCFLAYLASAQEHGAISRSVQNGQLKCPSCTTCYSVLDLATSKCPDEITAALLKFEMDYRVTQSNKLVREEEEAKKKKEIEDLLAMDELSREVRVLCHKITDDILTPKCPRCKHAFVDFDGCFALTCGNNVCQAGFCAYCFEDCGEDAHRHVANCKLNPIKGEMFGNLRTLEQVWKTVRQNEIQQLLRKLKKEVRKKLFESMEKEFKELGIRI